MTDIRWGHIKKGLEENSRRHVVRIAWSSHLMARVLPLITGHFKPIVSLKRSIKLTFLPNC